MKAIQRVDSTRRILGAAAIMGAIAWGVALTLMVLALASLASALSPDVAVPDDGVSLVASTAGAIVTGILLWRDRHLSSRARVALWIEEKIPVLHYSLVTAIDPSFSGAATRNFAAGLEATVARADIARATGNAVRNAIFPALAAVAAAAALLYMSPASAFGNAGLLARLGDRASGSAATPGSRLEDLEVVVTPPAYAGARVDRFDDPASIAALTGSRILVTGPGAAEGVRASVGVSRLEVSETRRGWSVSLTMPRKPVALVLGDRGYERLMVLEPKGDAPPRIVLDFPARDSTLRAARGGVRLRATATDDIGLNEAYFEYLVTTGSGEIFSARTVTAPAIRFGGSRTGSLSATVDLAALKLGQGDVISMRAIASDRNTLSGPGIATSDTRTFRIARADEYDSVSVDAAAPAAMDSSAISQRMLIIMTEELVAKAKTLSRAELVKQSTSIGDMEDRIRKRVDAILNATDSPDEQAHLEEAGHVHTVDENAGPVNKDLLEAYNALWEAVRSLQIAEPAPALPPMRVALKALDRARLANRLYLRGVPPKVIVDLGRVRLVGKEKGFPSLRNARTAADTVTEKLAERFSDAIEMLPGQFPGALRALTLLRVDAISAAPSFAAALGEAIAALRSGRDVTVPLLRARRALEGEPTGTSGLPSWSGGLVSEFVFCTGRYESGDWDSAPTVPANLIDSVARYTAIDVAPAGATVSLSSETILDYPLVYLTGHLPFRFTEAERRNARKLVDRGGMIFIDDHNHDIGGVFHKTAMEEISRSFAPPRDLPNDHVLFKSFFRFDDGPPATSHELNGWGDNLVHKNLQAVMRGDRIGVLYSSKDYSSEWNYHPDNKRFSAIDNTRFGVNIIVYALTR